MRRNNYIELNESADEKVENIKIIIENNNEVIEQLKHDEKVRKYIDLINSNSHLVSELRYAKEEAKLIEYCKCNHIWVKVPSLDKSYDNEYYGCIKCGLDERIIPMRCRWAFYGSGEVAMYQYFSRAMINERKRINTLMDDNVCSKNIICDLEKAHSIYLDIISKNPNVDNETIKQLFEEEYGKIANTFMKSLEEQDIDGIVKKIKNR